MSSEALKAKDWILKKVLKDLRKITTRHYNPKGIRFDLKADQSPVTIADRKAEELFRKLATKTTPEFGIIGEEFGTIGGDREWVWTVDPIDGTRAFSRGLPFWGTQIGLLHHGEPVAGVIDYPALGKTIWAVARKGSWCVQTKKRLRISQQKELQKTVCLHAGVSSFVGKQSLQPFERLMKQCYLERAYGDCAAYWYLLNGQADLLFDMDLKIWDCVPLFPLIEEAGGAYLTLDGQREWRHTKPFIAGNASLVDQALRSLSTF